MNDIKYTLDETIRYEQYLISVLEQNSDKRDYFSRTKADILSGSYKDNFNDLIDTREKCKNIYVDINYLIQHLTKCKKLIIELNKVLMESTEIINKKKVANLQGVTRTFILDNRPYFEKYVDYQEEDIEKEEDSEETKNEKRQRRDKKDIIQNILREIYHEDIGTDEDYEEEGQEQEEDDEYEDPLHGTSTFPQHLMNGPDGGSMIKTRYITPFLFENAHSGAFSSAKSNGSMRIFDAQRCKKNITKKKKKNNGKKKNTKNTRIRRK
jgi:hypothetical protein